MLVSCPADIPIISKVLKVYQGTQMVATDISVPYVDLLKIFGIALHAYFL